MAHIIIKNDGSIDGTKIFIDGKEVEGICRVEFIHQGGKFPVVRFEMTADSISIDTCIIPELTEIYKPFYRKIEPSDNDKEIAIAMREQREFENFIKEFIKDNSSVRV